MGKGAGKGSGECSRILLWMLWVTVWLITGIFCALAVISFAKLWEASTELQFGFKSLALNKIWRAPLCALALSALLVFGFNTTSCVVLIKKSVNRGGPGFSFGFMVAFSVSLSIFLLLSGLVLDGFRPVVKTSLEPVFAPNGTLISGVKSWSSYSSQGFIGAEVLALISFVVYFLFGIALIILQGAVSDQLGITAAAGYGPAPSAPAPDIKAAPPAYDQYAQYEQYGYTEDGQQQQFYDPSVLGVGYGPQVPVDADGHTDPTGTYYTQGYAAVNTQQAAQFQGSPQAHAYSPGAVAAPPVYAQTGFAAVGGYNTMSSMGPEDSYVPPTMPQGGRGGQQI